MTKTSVYITFWKILGWIHWWELYFTVSYVANLKFQMKIKIAFAKQYAGILFFYGLTNYQTGLLVSKATLLYISSNLKRK